MPNLKEITAAHRVLAIPNQSTITQMAALLVLLEGETEGADRSWVNAPFDKHSAAILNACGYTCVRQENKRAHPAHQEWLNTTAGHAILVQNGRVVDSFDDLSGHHVGE